MYIIICGADLTGKGLAKRLSQQKHDVVVIDVNLAACEEIYANYGTVTINGNATDIEILESAGIDRCDVGVATMRSDADNLAFAMLAKHHKVPQIIVKMNDPKYEDVYKTVGVKNISRGTELLIDQIMLNIEDPELRTVICFGNIEICIFIIPKNAHCVGQKVAELVSLKGFPEQINITCIFKDSTNSYIIPRGDTELNEMDKVFLCGSIQDIKEAVKFLS